jgi:hypothetical protein
MLLVWSKTMQEDAVLNNHYKGGNCDHAETAV